MNEECGSCEYNRQCFIKKNVGIYECEKTTDMNEKIKALFPDNVETITISKNDYDRLYGQMTYENIILQQEIDRLNNIINELEKYCWELKTMGCREGALAMLDKLKELKEENK